MAKAAEAITIPVRSPGTKEGREEARPSRSSGATSINAAVAAGMISDMPSSVAMNEPDD